MATKRKTLTKKVRFEVFKRDSFKCQYCGAAAPEVLLEVDHITPVSKGGTNEILNLITSCFDCNRGKSSRKIDDKSEVVKQKQQMDQLNEKRNQLKMMMEWRNGLEKLEEEKFSLLMEKWSDNTGYTLIGNGIKTAKKLLKEYDLTLVLDAVEKATSQYLDYDEEGDVTLESVNHCWSKVPRIAKMLSTGGMPENLKQFYYVRGIMRNRYKRIDDKEALNLISKAHEHGASIEDIKDFVIRCESYDEFFNGTIKFIEEEK